MENVALTMREIADRVNNEKEQKKITAHQEFVELKVIPFLQEEAEAGRYSASFPTPGYDIGLARNLLRELGFTADTFTSGKTRYLSVKW